MGSLCLTGSKKDNSNKVSNQNPNSEDLKESKNKKDKQLDVIVNKNKIKTNVVKDYNNNVELNEIKTDKNKCDDIDNLIYSGDIKNSESIKQEEEVIILKEGILNDEQQNPKSDENKYLINTAEVKNPESDQNKQLFDTNEVKNPESNQKSGVTDTSEENLFLLATTQEVDTEKLLSIKYKYQTEEYILNNTLPELRVRNETIFDCSVKKAIEIVPDKIDVTKVLNMSESPTLMTHQEKHNWGTKDGYYIYHQNNGTTLKESWYLLDYENNYYQYGLIGKDFCPLLNEELYHMWFLPVEGEDKKCKFVWIYTVIPNIKDNNIENKEFIFWIVKERIKFTYGAINNWKTQLNIVLKQDEN